MKRLHFIIPILSLFLSSCEKNQTLFIADHYVDCAGLVPQKCLLVKENDTDDWILFKDTIEGFSYEEGYTYQLKVRITKVLHPQADASSLKYTLVEVISKVKSSKVPINLPTSTEQTIKSMEGDWEVFEIAGFENLTNKKPTFSIKNGKINGNNGCNNFGGNFELMENNAIAIDNLFSTKMFCIETANLETAFMGALHKATTLKLENTDVTFFDAEGKNLFKVRAISSHEKTEKAGNIPMENSKTEKYIITYSTGTRGFSKKLIFDGNTIQVIQEIPNKEIKSIDVSESDLQLIEKLIEKIDLENLKNLIPPSTKHQFDGAKHASFQIKIEEKTFLVPTFDDGNPPTTIEPLLKKLESLIRE